MHSEKGSLYIHTYVSILVDVVFFCVQMYMQMYNMSTHSYMHTHIS